MEMANMITILSYTLSVNVILTEIGIGLLIAGLLAWIYISQFRRLKKRFSSQNLTAAFKEKQLLEQLFNNMPDRIYFKDRESRFILANKYVSRVMGEEDPKKLIGKTDFEFYDKKYAQGFFDDEQRIMKEGKPMISKEEKGLNLDGGEVFVSTTKIPIKDRSGKVIGIIGIGRDITPQKQAEEELHRKSESLRETNVLLEERQEEIQQMAEELNTQAENLKKINLELERLSLVASNTENTVVIMDGNGNFEWVNEGFERRYGSELGQFTKENGPNLRDNSSNSNISAILNQIYITKKPYTYNSKSRDREGNEIWSQTNISPILDENKEITNLILIDSDITDLKEAESKIRKQNVEIEKQARELEKTNATKDRLFSIIAHDLKNPFHSIMGFTDLLLTKQHEIEADKLQEFLEMISSSTHSAYQLLENLLEWARTQTDSTKFSPSTFPLKELVAEIISLLELHASNKNIMLEENIGEGLEVYADRNMLHTVIRNIASNAVKYTGENGKVTLSAESGGDSTVISIRDNGIGMPESRINTLFQLDEVNSTAGTSGETGTGLGLIVSWEFMKKNKGSIDVVSTPGKGSEFILKLPHHKA